MKHEVILRKIDEYLRMNGPKNTCEILDHINATAKYGMCYHSAANLLPKSGMFRKLPYKEMASNGSQSYMVSVWEARD